MFHGRKLNHRINRIHERCLRLIYKDYLSSFQELLDKDSSLTIHERNLHKLAMEIYRVKNKLCPILLNKFFEFKDLTYHLRNSNTINPHKFNTIRYGRETLSFAAHKIWDFVPMSCKEAINDRVFKREIKKWKPVNCPCQICKIYIAGVGYI